MTVWQIVAVSVAGAVALAVGAAILARALFRRGVRVPIVVRAINRLSEQVVTLVKRPVTMAVLDEVAAVLETGNYTRNVAAALRENHDQIKAMLAEKISQDPTTRRIGLLPFHDRLVDEVSETALRVLLALLLDPRTDELVSDALRDNLTQIREAVRDRQGRV